MKPTLTLLAALLLAPFALLHAADAPAKKPDMIAGKRPNIIVILADDMGFSDLGCYGSEIQTPNLDGLAAGGLRFTQFYNTARCCPTRASLLTGLYPHQAGIGHMTEDRGLDGFAGDLNNRCVTIAQVLQRAGYATFAVGKWHVTHHTGPNGPKYNWPLQRGFDRYYGTIQGAGSFYDPACLTRDNTQISPVTDPEYQPTEYYYTTAITDHAIRFAGEHHQKSPQQPFFMYVAYTAAHWPMHALEKDIAKYKGKYDQGYNPIRKARFEREQAMGLIDPKWQLSPQWGTWDTVQHKPWEARCMEVYAAMIDCMDQGIGRIVASLNSSGQLDNTLILFLQDNGGNYESIGRTSPRNPPPGRYPMRGPDFLEQEGIPRQTRDGLPVRQGPGVMPGPRDTYIAYGQGWANVSNVPFREYKHFVHEGGIATPLIAHWPARITRKNQLEKQPCHLIDVMATCVDLSGATYPKELNSQPITPMEGRSLLPAFEDQPIKRDALYWEHEGNRAVRAGNWKLVAKARCSPGTFSPHLAGTGAWELYDMETDRTEMHDLAAKMPDKVNELREKWEAYAMRTHVLPWPWQPKGLTLQLKPTDDALPASLAEDSGPAVNLLPNPSFEEKEVDGVKSWKSRAWAGKENARWSVASLGRTGERCVSIASDRGCDAAWTTKVSVQQGAWYRLSGWIKTKDVRGATGALLHIQNMPDVWTPAVSGTRGWTRVATEFQADATTDLEINCLFGGWGSSTGQAWYEDLALEPVAEPHDEPLALVTIDTGAPSVLYSPMIFGGFLEHFDKQIYGGVFEPGSPLSDEKGFRRDVLAALKELKVPIVRWPGGCYVSGYRWEAGVGKTRKPTDDMAWGVVEPNTFGTDEYVELCRTLGWTPYICNNAGNGTVEEMRNWVDYCNGSEGNYAQRRKNNGYAEPRNVPIWSIGNENYWEQEIGYKPIEQWAPLVLEGAKAMKKADPRIQLTAAALPTREWTLPLLKTAGDYLDSISLHGYWIYHGNKGSVHMMPDYLTCIMHSESPEKRISDFIDILEESGYRGRIKIAFDEWNLRAWYHPGFPRKTVQDYNDPEVQRLVAARADNDIASQYTMADALFSASFFNACLRHAEDVGMANIAPLLNTRGPLFVHPKGIVRRTHFHAMAMYANELESRVGKLELEAGTLRHGNRGIPVLDGVATVDESGTKWAIALVNRHPAKPVACTVRMKEAMLDGEHAALVLAGDSPEAFNDIGNPNRVAPQKTTLTFSKGAVTLPPHSLTILKVLPK